MQVTTDYKELNEVKLAFAGFFSDELTINLSDTRSYPRLFISPSEEVNSVKITFNTWGSEIPIPTSARLTARH